MALLLKPLNLILSSNDINAFKKRVIKAYFIEASSLYYILRADAALLEF